MRECPFDEIWVVAFLGLCGGMLGQALHSICYSLLVVTWNER